VSQESREVTATEFVIPSNVQALFSAFAVLLRREDRKAYENLLREVAKIVKPLDFLDWLWTKDVVDITWSILRLRSFEAQNFEAFADPAQAYRFSLQGCQVFAKLIETAELRRDRILREIGLRRDILAQRLRKVSDEIIDAQANEAPLAVNSPGN
jgi:hypothetical protein